MSLKPPAVTVNAISAPALETQPLLSPTDPNAPVVHVSSLSAPELVPDSRPLPITRRIASRLLLKHVVDNRPLWHLFRILAGAAAVLAINKAVGCTDDLSAVFNFFLCISAFSGSTLLAVREVLVGGVVGGGFGILFCILTHAASQDTTGFFQYTWQTVWTVPLAMVTVYYVLSVLGGTGPDKLQLLSAETSAILLITTPFPYPPIAKFGMGEWSILVESFVTRAISLTNGCLTALLFRLIGKGFTWLYGKYHVWKRHRMMASESEDEISHGHLDAMRHASSAPSVSPRARRVMLRDTSPSKWHPPML